MSVLTEAMLRVQLKAEDLDALREFRVEKGVIVTPSAKAFLMDHKIDLIVGDKRILKAPGNEGEPDAGGAAAPKARPAQPPAKEGDSYLPAFEKPAGYTGLDGGQFPEKPEHMTALRGTTLVTKDHKVICLRGRLDSLEAKILEVQVALHRQGLDRIVADLDEVLAYVRVILGSEVKGSDVPPMHLMGMEEAEIRDRSHKPKQYYGINHFGASWQDGEAVVLLNALRTQVREVELVAYSTFKDEYGVPVRPDIVQALNRLSSAFYVMMMRVKAKEYEHASG